MRHILIVLSILFIVVPTCYGETNYSLSFEIFKVLQKSSWAGTTLEVDGPIGFGGEFILHELFNNPNSEISFGLGYAQGKDSGHWVGIEDKPIDVTVIYTPLRAQYRYIWGRESAQFKPYLGGGLEYQIRKKVYGGNNWIKSEYVSIGFNDKTEGKITFSILLGARLAKILFFEFHVVPAVISSCAWSQIRGGVTFKL